MVLALTGRLVTGADAFAIGSEGLMLVETALQVTANMTAREPLERSAEVQHQTP
jgi:hypothetical protein